MTYDRHTLLQDTIKTILKNHGFFVDSAVKINKTGDSKFPPGIFGEETEVDIYCRSKPSLPKAEIFASDFIIECKTGRNLNKQDLEKIIGKAKCFPVYVAYFDADYNKIDKQIEPFLKSNQIGLAIIEENSKNLTIKLPAFSRVSVSSELENNDKSYSIEHQLFEVFRSQSGPEKVILPLDLMLHRDETTYEHVFNDPKNLREFFGLRNKLITILQKDGFETAESWSLFPDIHESAAYHGFNIQSLTYTVRTIYANKNKKITENIKPINSNYANIKSSWHNDNFIFSVSAQKGWDSLLFVIWANVHYNSNEITWRFDQTCLYCKDQLGSNFSSELDIKKTRLRKKGDFFEEQLSKFAKKTFEVKELKFVQSLTRNYARGQRSMIESDNPSYYFYDRTKEPLLIQVRDYANEGFWRKKPIKIEPLPMMVRRRIYSIDSVTFQPPCRFQEVLNRNSLKPGN